MEYNPISYEKEDYLNQPEGWAGNGVNTSSIFSNIGSGSIESIRENIEDIYSLIDSRKELHENMMKEMSKVEMEINNFLTKQQEEMPREELLLFKEKSIELAESRRNEMLNCWRDITRLKEELRGHKREINERENRRSMLDSILSK